MNTAIFGGSFDPVHRGHLSLASEVLNNTRYGKILFIPAGIPPHKILSDAATGKQRIEMLENALSGESAMELWDGEVRREGKSFTVDTVRELKRIGLVEGTPGLVIGDDLIQDFGKWREAENLQQEVDLILARRLTDGPVESSLECLKLHNEIWPFSSSEVSALIGSGQKFSHLLPHGVAGYIMENRLYGYRG